MMPSMAGKALDCAVAGAGDMVLPQANIVPYSWKYWRALNLAVEPKIAIERILADLNLAVRYGIAIRIYASRRILIWQL